MSHHVTLHLGKDKVKVPREGLISKSKYFAGVLSLGCRNLEHTLNYDIRIDTLKTFVDWVSDGVASVIGDRRRTKPSLVKYVGNSADFESLLQLLQLSMLFSSDTLIEDLTNLIACHWLIPQKCVRIWLVARQLNLATLRDLAKATCIDRLQEVPESSLLELARTDFVELLGSIRVKFTPTFPFELLRRWVDRHVPPGGKNVFDAQYPFTLLQGHISYNSPEVKEMFDDQYWKQNMQCIVGYKRIGDNKAMCIFVWDGTKFSKLVDVPSSTPFFNSNIGGVQATSRGFDIYLAGGQYKNDPARFQMEIWRYSLISKTWYYVTSMPRPRTFMAIGFFHENLFLVGGRQSPISTVDIYNVHTGQWWNAPNMQEPVVADAVVFENRGTLSIWSKRLLYSYNKDNNSWVVASATLIDRCDADVDEDVNAVYASGFQYFYPSIIINLGNHMYVLTSFIEHDIQKLYSVETLTSISNQSVEVASSVAPFNNQVSNGPYLVGFARQKDRIYVQVIKITGKSSAESKIIYEEKITSETESISILDQIGCFNVYKPTSLNELFVLKKKAK